MSRKQQPDADDVTWIEPATVEEAAEMLADAWKRGMTTAVADGTRACQPPPDVRLVSTGRLNRILRLDRDNAVVVAEAGASIEALRLAADAASLWCPALRWLPGQTSIGAAVAGGHGRRGRRYGAVADYLLGTRFICPSAGLVRHGGMAIKNASGYNLSASIAGSRGTLSVVVEVILRLVPKPASRLIRLVRFSSGEIGLAAARSLADIALGVDALEVASRLSDDGALLLVELEDAAQSAAENRLNQLLARSGAFGGVTEDLSSWPPFHAESAGLTKRTSVDLRRFADICARIATRARDRGIEGWLLAEATGGAVELTVADGDAAMLEQIVREASGAEPSSSPARLHAAIKLAFDPNDLLRSL